MAKDTDAPAPQAHAIPIEYEEEAQLPLLGFISITMRWVEELITTISGFVLTVATGIGVVDLLSDGKLTADSPNIDLIYAVSMAIGIGGQLVGLSARMSRMFSTGKWVQGALHIPVIALLAYVEYLAGVVYGFHKTFGDSVQTSLANLSIQERDFISDRTWVAVGLIILCGALRYQKKPKKSIEQIEAEEEFKRRKNEAQGKTQAAQLARFRGAITQTVGRKDEVKANESTDDSTPNDGTKDASLPEERPRIEPHLVALNWHDKDAQWWDKAVLIAWVLDEYHLPLSEAKANQYLQDSSKDSTGQSARVASPGNPYCAMKDDVMAHTKTKMRLKKAPRNPKTKDNMIHLPLAGDRSTKDAAMG